MTRQKEVTDLVNAHIKEAVDSYSGKLEIRSDKFTSKDKSHSLRDVKIQVDTVVIVYDKALVTKEQRTIIEDHVANKDVKGKTIKVIFR